MVAMFIMKTASTEYRPSRERNNCLPNQEISHVSWNLKVYFNVLKRLSLIILLNI
jgi:hypothetical protein